MALNNEVFNISTEHEAATHRERRLILHYDPLFFDYRPDVLDPSSYAEVLLRFTNYNDFTINTVMWDVDGALACYPSEYIPHYPGFADWLAAGHDFLPDVVSRSRVRGLEVFFSYRVNSNCDPNFDSVDHWSEHPDWLIDYSDSPNAPPDNHRFSVDPNREPTSNWNYANPKLREFQLAAVEELVQRYDLDGLQLDFARTPPFFDVGHQWELRDHLTEWLHDIRSMMLRIEAERSRPLLLAVRIGPSIEGCHFDGIDIEAWLKHRLVDLVIVGCRTFDLDITEFRCLEGSEHVKFYPCHDNHHSSDAYKHTPLPMLRGIATNWSRRGADGIVLFNFEPVPVPASVTAGLRDPLPEPSRQDWEANHTFLVEAGDPERFRGKEKTFVLERRAGGSPWEIGYPEDRVPITHTFLLANMLAPLPSPVGIHARGTTLFRLFIGDDLTDRDDASDRSDLRMIVSDMREDNNVDVERIESGVIRVNPYGGLYRSTPIARDALEALVIRINNVRLSGLEIDAGWITFPVPLKILAAGVNLISVGIDVKNCERISVERLELTIR